ncbi:hypothetical protein AXK58_14300 [Tsukamurella tyrosinosolvens]|nr:hypothetical protein AXK58_14300 [Tsukamurella tyrosinosolvens]
MAREFHVHLREGATERSVLAAHPVSQLPSEKPFGPQVYVVLDAAGTPAYVGQTSQALRERFRGHLRSPDKSAVFACVATIPLDPDTPALVVNRIERVARTLLRPTMGRAWPVGRT